MGACNSRQREPSTVVKATQEEFDAAVLEAMDFNMMTKDQATKYVQKQFRKKKINMDSIIIDFVPLDPPIMQASCAMTESEVSGSTHEDGDQIQLTREALNALNVSSAFMQISDVPADSSFTCGVNTDLPTLDLSSHETLMF